VILLHFFVISPVIRECWQALTRRAELHSGIFLLIAFVNAMNLTIIFPNPQERR
jgi:hypothetical protein